jgi:hypothetical protein
MAIGKRPRHGLASLKRAVSARGIAGLDARTTPVRAVNEWRDSIVADLGGQEAVSSQKATLIDAAARTVLYLNHIDCFLMQQPGLVNKRRKSVIPVLMERQKLVDSLAKLLTQIGLHRVPKAIPDLQAYLKQREREQTSTKASDATETGQGEAITEPEGKEQSK